MNRLTLVLLLIVLLALLSRPTKGHTSENAHPHQPPSASLKNSYCTYGAPPRFADKRINVAELVNELLDLHANTYRWIYKSEETNNFADLEKFLPLARAKNIRVWVTVNPPSERPKGLSAESLRRDYRQYALKFAELSLQQTNFVAWGIDDFVWNLKFFTPDELDHILQPARELNPRLAFVPTCYYKKITADFASRYGRFIDGVMFPYRDESAGANFENSNHVEREIQQIRQVLPNRPVIVGVFASRHSQIGLSSPDYVRRVMATAKPLADGISVYRHPNKVTDREKYEIVKHLFTEWTVPPK